MRLFAIAVILGISFYGSGTLAQEHKGWSSAGTYHNIRPVKKPHNLNTAKQASRVNGARVKKGTPSGASSGHQHENAGKVTPGAEASGPHSHPLHGAGSNQWH